ncbi:hypothetical protein ACE4RU_10730 [Actinobacillus seminis]|uniref:hypothetical protein n=1 Tax=Actinobacillus seminis TaxID=722 RepID=UPI003B94BA6E
MERLNVNINVLKAALFYWQDSQEAYLELASRNKEKREFYLAQASVCAGQLTALSAVVFLTKNKVQGVTQ